MKKILIIIMLIILTGCNGNSGKDNPDIDKPTIDISQKPISDREFLDNGIELISLQQEPLWATGKPNEDRYNSFFFGNTKELNFAHYIETIGNPRVIDNYCLYVIDNQGDVRKITEVKVNYIYQKTNYCYFISDNKVAVIDIGGQHCDLLHTSSGKLSNLIAPCSEEKGSIAIVEDGNLIIVDEKTLETKNLGYIGENGWLYYRSRNEIFYAETFWRSSPTYCMNTKTLEITQYNELSEKVNAIYR